MLKIILDKHIIFVAVGVVAAIGVVSKCVVNVTLKRLVHAAGNMSKSNHPFMRLVRAKFEHACMVSEKVENVGVFVDKYLYEYKVIGMKLHSIRRLEVAAAFICVLLGAAGALLEYAVNGMADMVLRIGAFGVGVGIFVYLFHLTTDENYRLAMVKNYMVDYLQNVCLHRYQKTYQKELQVMTPEVPVVDFSDVSKKDRSEVMAEPEPQRQQPSREVPAPEVAPQPYETPHVNEPIRGTVANASKPVTEPAPEVPLTVRTVMPEKEESSEPQEKKPPVNKDILIRQILEEFMA